jgi:DNA double-strand break repair helicase HerA and related ATPase
MDKLILGGDGQNLATQTLSMSNRHGLIAGATGTGKTITLQILAEGFAKAGVPVFCVDVKGDLAGVSQTGKSNKEIERRKTLLSLNEFQHRGYATLFWDIYGERGHPVRTTISEMGPDILAALLDLNETQCGVLYACFAIADDDGMLLLDLKDLRSMLTFVGENAKTLRSEYGNISSASVGAIQRRLLVLEAQGGERFFGEPALQLADLMHKDFSGQGVISLLDGERLLRESPKLYAAFLLWLMSELFEELPEVGDPEKPEVVLFFDEAHLLFRGMPKGLLQKVEQVFRLIRSKGVGIYLISQSPLDIPANIAGQLGMKIQHALRAFTPKDQKVLRGVVQGFRNDNNLDLQKTLTSLGVGEAVVSTLDESGAPSSALVATMVPPESAIGPVDDQIRADKIKQAPISGKYENDLDRESAYEILAQRAELAAKRAVEQAELEARREAEEKEARERAKQNRSRGSSSRRQGFGEAFFKSAARSVGRSLGSKLVRGLLGSLLK